MGGPHIIVIADDEPAVLRLIEETISVDGDYSVVATSDGNEAWRAIRAHRPAAVVHPTSPQVRPSPGFEPRRRGACPPNG